MIQRVSGDLQEKREMRRRREKACFMGVEVSGFRLQVAGWGLQIAG
jgi:hypothetical protein